ncbi:CPBP family intramembrane glutamic endopeptidase [Intrasporangium sp.]|uniref:CPBP family intramembrane glutamic endopeptidase n=1 Tax=Intrasporangium sp. TaxID=1925024 RepID=UPI003221CD8D
MSPLEPGRPDPTGVRAHHALQRGYAAYPRATAAALFAALATVRLLGAFSQSLMVVSVVLTPLVLLVLPRAAWATVGLRPAVSARRVAEGIAVVVASYALSVGACVLLVGTGRDNWALGLRTLVVDTAPAAPAGLVALGAVLVLGLLVPLAEETCFRGVLHTTLANRHGGPVAVVVTAAAWALVHLGDYGLRPFDGTVIAGVLPSVFLMGLALGFCRVRTGSVYACVLAQGVANLLLLGWVLTW